MEQQSRGSTWNSVVRALPVVLVLMVLLAACGGAAEDETADAGGDTTSEAGDGGEAGALDPDNPVQISLGTIPIAPLLPAFMAAENGWFAEEGLDVELRPEPGGQDIVTAVAAGEFDFGFSNQTSLLIARSQGIDIKAVTSGVLGEPDAESAWDAVIVPEDSPIQSAQDLIGKTVSVNTLNNTPHLVMLRSLEVNGVENPQEQIEFTEVQFPDAVGAVTEGQIDAAWVVEPFVTVGELSGTRTILTPYIDTAPDLLVSVYFTSNDLIQEQPEVVAAFMRVMNRAMDHAAENPDEVRAAFPEFNENASPEVAEQMALPFWSSELSVEEFEEPAALAQRYGFIDEVPNLDEVIYTPPE